MAYTTRLANTFDFRRPVTARLALAVVPIAIGVLACSLGGAAEPAPEVGGEGVPVSKATPTSVDQPATTTDVPPAPTIAPEPTQVPAAVAGPVQVEPSDADVPFRIVDLNVRMDVLVPVLFGLVENVSDTTLGSVEITIFFLDEQKNVVGESSGYSGFFITAPGELSPFEVYFPEVDPDTVSSVALGADWTPYSGTFPDTREGFELEGVQGAWGEFDHYEVSGTLINSNPKLARFVDLAIAFYNSTGKLIGLYVDRVFDVEAGGSDFFTISVVSSYFTEPEIDHFEILLEGSLEE